eukprot:c17536_g1_i1.p1 GENE.c17536_g1_i1~~c17536_g1_i1.p1  ORF type:complete len:123 (+),score=37.13 c17536_g1_i1:28-369(+)
MNNNVTHSKYRSGFDNSGYEEESDDMQYLSKNSQNGNSTLYSSGQVVHDPDFGALSNSMGSLEISGSSSRGRSSKGARSADKYASINPSVTTTNPSTRVSKQQYQTNTRPFIS